MATSPATLLTRNQWLKEFPPVQARAIRGATQCMLSGLKIGVPNSIVSNAVLAADPELSILNVQAGIPYSVSLFLNITASAAAGGLQFDFGASTATIQAMGIQSQFTTSAGVVTAGAIASTLTTAVSGGTTNVNVAAFCSGFVLFATPGSFALRVAQAASSATPTVVDVGSILLLEAAGVTFTA